MRLDELEVRIKKHAYERYCQRVEPITSFELEALVAAQLQQDSHLRWGYIQLDGVWWRGSIDGGTLTLHTCYGRHHIDLPAAVQWAKRHNDRIVLGDAYGE